MAMNYEEARCPSCKAIINVLPDAPFAFCSSCGNKLVPKTAIESRKIELNGVSTVDNDLVRGKQCIDANDWLEAYKYYCTAIDKDATRLEAWFGCFLAMTRNFTSVEEAWIKIEGNKGLKAVVENCVEYSQRSPQCDSLNKIRGFLNEITTKKADLVNYFQENGRSIRKRRIWTALIFYPVLLVNWDTKSESRAKELIKKCELFIDIINTALNKSK